MAELVGDLELAEFDISDAGFAGRCLSRPAGGGQEARLARQVADLLHRARPGGWRVLPARRQTAFPGREIAELFGITGGRLAEQIDANILNLTGDRHRRLRALVAPAFTPRAAAKWRPAMRDIAASLWAELGGQQGVRFRVVVRRAVSCPHDRGGHWRAPAGRRRCCTGCPAWYSGSSISGRSPKSLNGSSRPCASSMTTSMTCLSSAAASRPTT